MASYKPDSRRNARKGVDRLWQNSLNWFKGRAGPHVNEPTTGVLTSQMLLGFGSNCFELDRGNYSFETVGAVRMMIRNG